jgi:hypothetical protein
MKLMDRVLEVQNSSVEKRIEREQAEKEAFIKAIEKPVLEAAEQAKSFVTVEYSIARNLAITALKEQGFDRLEFKDGKVVIYLTKQTDLTRRDGEFLSRIMLYCI